MRACIVFASLASLAAGRLQGQLHTPPALIEGTWELVAWRIGSDTLLRPKVEGVFSVRDGVILWQIRGTHKNTVLNRVGLGRYTVDSSSFSYRYSSGLEVDRVMDGPTIVHDSLPFAGTRTFGLTRLNGEARYVTRDGRQPYTVAGDTLVIVQNGALSRKYVRSRASR